MAQLQLSALRGRSTQLSCKTMNRMYSSFTSFSSYKWPFYPNVMLFKNQYASPSCEMVNSVNVYSAFLSCLMSTGFYRQSPINPQTHIFTHWWQIRCLTLAPNSTTTDNVGFSALPRGHFSTWAGTVILSLSDLQFIKQITSLQHKT